MAIPIANLYYLLAYAWDGRESVGEQEVSGLCAQTPMDLVAELLAISAEGLLKRGLDRGYVERSEDLRRPRGKLDLSTTIKRGVLRNRRVHCRLAELRRNVPHNQVVKAGLRTLAGSESVDNELRKRLRKAAERMRGVGDAPLGRQLFRRLQLHRNNSRYRFPVRLAELVLRHLIVDPCSGTVKFPDFAASQQEMGHIFERFVRNFLAREQREFGVSAALISWDARYGSAQAAGLLPTMRSDVSLKRPGERVVIETKFYEEPLSSHYGKRSLRSGHLYQLLAYLRSLSADRPHSDITGVLLYAGTGFPLALDYEVHGIPLKVRSLDLDQSWKSIRSDLLAMVTDSSEKAALSRNYAGHPSV